MAEICAASRVTFHRTVLRCVAVLCCLLVLSGAVSALADVAQHSILWGLFGFEGQNIATGDHLQVLETQTKRYALVGDEHNHVPVDRDADAVTVEPQAQPARVATYSVASRYLVNKIITLYLDKNIIGSSE